jgi:hypothetical protein
MWAGAAGTTSMLSLLLLALFFAVYALTGDDGSNPFGTANDLVGSLAAALMIPVALALRVQLPARRVGRAAEAAGIAAMAALTVAGPLLVAGALPFNVHTPIALAAYQVLALWLIVTNRRLRRSQRLSPRLTRLGELAGAAQVTGTAIVGCALLLSDGWPQHVLLAIGLLTGAAGWLAIPIWFLALGRELAPRAGGQRRAVPAIRRAAGRVHLALALLIVLGVFAQVYLIGAYIFGAGTGALHAHESVGFTVHGFEVLLLLVALVAWLPRADVALSLLMAVLGTAQIAFADAQAWAGGLHPLGALFVLALATQLARRARARATRPPAMTSA